MVDTDSNKNTPGLPPCNAFSNVEYGDAENLIGAGKTEGFTAQGHVHGSQVLIASVALKLGVDPARIVIIYGEDGCIEEHTVQGDKCFFGVSSWFDR